jgi:hypothetical protein
MSPSQLAVPAEKKNATGRHLINKKLLNHKNIIFDKMTGAFWY